MTKKYHEIETIKIFFRKLKVPNQEQKGSITIQNSKLSNKENYLIAEIIRTQTIPSGTVGF